MPSQPAVLFDPAKTFDDNFDNGPFPVDTKESYVNKGEPTFKFLGHKLYSPFGIAAGPLPTSKHVAYAFRQGFDVVCYKTQRSTVFPCNDFPNVVYLDVEGDLTLEKAAKPIVGRSSTKTPLDKLTITNSFGNPSRGPNYWVEDMKEAVKVQGKGQLLISSVVGTVQEGFKAKDYYEDFAKAAEMAVSAGVQVIELNPSCPNVASEGVVCYTHDAVVGIAKLTKERIGNVPIIAKVGYFTKEQESLLQTIIKDSSPYISAYSAINTISAPIVDEEGNQLLPGEGRLKSGCCGSGIKWAGLDMVKRLSKLKQKLDLNYEIIGIGGVMNPADFHEYRKAGADVVQSCTGAIWNPLLGQEIKATL